MKFNKARVLIRGVAAILLLSVMLSSQPLPVKAAGGGIHLASWVKFPETRVLPIGNPTNWDETGVGAACVITDNVGAAYKMWYTGYNEAGVLRIGYATSDDGITWDKQGAPVLTRGGPGAWDVEGVGSPSVVKVADGDYRMWYTGYKKVDDENIPRIGYATWNGVADNWTKVSVANPVLAPEGAAWCEKGIHSPWVITDDAGAPFKMWYTGRSGEGLLGHSAIGYATWQGGADNWTKYNGGVAPVISPDGGTWDESGVATASVIKHQGKYYMWYTGYAAGSITVSIGAAQSDTGGTSWTKNANPVLAAGSSGWNSGGVGAPCVVEESAEHRITMWYTGLDGGLTPRVGRALYPRINVTVSLQGNDRTETELTVPFIIKLFGTGVTLDWSNIVPKMYQQTSANFTTADYTNPNWPGITGAGGITIIDTVDATPTVSGNVTLMVSGVVPGTYQMAITSHHNLISVKSPVVVAAIGETVDMTELLEGNGDDSWKIDITDFGLLADAFGKVEGQLGWDAKADYDNNLQINIADFTILAMNYGRESPVAVTG